MKHLLTPLLLLFSLTLSAQTTVVTGPKKKPQTTAVDNKKQQAEQQRKAAEAAEAKRKEQVRQEQLRKQRTEQAQRVRQSRQEQSRREQTQREEQARQEHLREVQEVKSLRSPHEIRTKVFTANAVSFKMCYVKGGTFMMGATAEQGSAAYNDEKPVHKVTLGDYYIGQTEVTQALWKAVMGVYYTLNPNLKRNDNFPVEYVSWDECQTFIKKLNSLTGCSFRLPTEAQWEFAARGGNNSKDYKYSGSNDINDVAFNGTVAAKRANELGIYDMSGNVSEWCSDWYGENYYNNQSVYYPTGPLNGSRRVHRGGRITDCRVSSRNSAAPSAQILGVGLRLMLLP